MKEQIIDVIVDSERDFDSAILAGKFDIVFRLQVEEYVSRSHGKGQKLLRCRLVHYGKTMTHADVVADFRKRDLLPATPDILLAVGEQYPKLQRQFPIVALGHTWRVRSWEFVMALTVKSTHRWLRLRKKDEPWCADSRFLAIAQNE